MVEQFTILEPCRLKTPLLKTTLQMDTVEQSTMKAN